jgi:hypothetical protein
MWAYMPEHKKKIPILGLELEVSSVPIRRATEFFNEYELEDGSVLKVKNVATSVLRVDGQFNPVDGKPVYLVLTAPVVSVESAEIKPAVGAPSGNAVKV